MLTLSEGRAGELISAVDESSLVFGINSLLELLLLAEFIALFYL